MPGSEEKEAVSLKEAVEGCLLAGLSKMTEGPGSGIKMLGFISSSFTYEVFDPRQSS